MFKFRKEIEAILRQSGWTPERSVEITRFTKPLTEEGFVFNPPSAKILRNLGDLKIVPSEHPANLFFPSMIFFDPYYAASGELDRVASWQSKYNLAFSPIGEYEPSYLLLSAEDGRIFSGREKKFLFLGDTIEDALEMRVLANRMPVPMP